MIATRGKTVYGPAVVTDGLVLYLDATNKKSYVPNSTFLNMSSWTTGTGSVAPYYVNENGSENLRLLGTNPWGDSAIVWQSMPSGNSEPDGGWNTAGFTIDKTKLYRFSVWVKRVSDSTSGNFYFGINPCVIRNDSSIEECNPYWDCAGIGGYGKDQWYLCVGHCFPYTYVGTIAHQNSGRYTTDGRIGALNGCNVGSGDVRWKSDSTYAVHRTYHYYSPDTTSHLQFYDPRIDLIDGTEVSIIDLYSKSPATWYDLSGNNNNGLLVNNPSHSVTNGGVFVFNGTNYIDISKNFQGANYTIIASARYTTISGRIITGKNNWLLGHWGNLTDSYYPEGWVHYGTNSDTLWRIYAGTGNYSTDSWELFVNGSSLGGANDGGSSAPNGFYVGGAGFGEPGIGEVGFLIGYNRVLSNSEVLQNYNALKTRFGL